MDLFTFLPILTTLVVTAQVLTVLGLLLFLINVQPINRVKKWIGANAQWLALAVTITAVSGSLLFSEYYEMEPCKLCWLQRIFIFPQLVLIPLAIIKKQIDRIIPYSAALAVMGFCISTYHYHLQLTSTAAEKAIPCSTVGQSPSCAAYYVIQLGYITIPNMALTFASSLIVIWTYRTWYTKGQKGMPLAA